MKVNIFKEHYEITVITADGWIATARQADHVYKNNKVEIPRVATSDIYTMNLSQVDPSSLEDSDHNLWDALSAGTMEYIDFEEYEYDSDFVKDTLLKELGYSLKEVTIVDEPLFPNHYKGVVNE